jgi:hypothetical protein
MSISCKHGNEPSGSLKGKQYLGWMSNYYVIKKDSVTWSWLTYGEPPCSERYTGATVKAIRIGTLMFRAQITRSGRLHATKHSLVSLWSSMLSAF